MSESPFQRTITKVLHVSQLSSMVKVLVRILSVQCHLYALDLSIDQRSCTLLGMRPSSSMNNAK